MNKLIAIKKKKFIQGLKKRFHNDVFIRTQVDRIEITKSDYIQEGRCVTIIGYDIRGEKAISYSYILDEDKLSMIYHIISMLSENENDLIKYWETILDFPDELIESEYYD